MSNGGISILYRSCGCCNVEHNWGSNKKNTKREFSELKEIIVINWIITVVAIAKLKLWWYYLFNVNMLFDYQCRRKSSCKSNLCATLQRTVTRVISDNPVILHQFVTFCYFLQFSFHLSVATMIIFQFITLILSVFYIL